MFTFASAKALKNLPEIPRTMRIPSPTTEIIAQPSLISTGSNKPSFSSNLNSALITFLALASSDWLMQNEIEYSDDD